jgi:hypothetical protein
MARVFADLCRESLARRGGRGIALLWLLGLYDTLLNSSEEWLMVLRGKWGKTAASGLGIVALIISWAALFIVVHWYTALFLVPWDTTLIEPPSGTFSQVLNDFFASPLGSVLPSWAITLTSVALFVRALRSGRVSALSVWIFAAINLACCVVGFLAMPVAIEATRLVWPYPTDRRDIGFHRSIIPFVALMLVVAINVSLQRRIGRPRAAPASFAPTSVY